MRGRGGPELPKPQVLFLAGTVDYLDAEERERLRESLRESIEQMMRGETMDAAEALASLQAK